MISSISATLEEKTDWWPYVTQARKHVQRDQGTGLLPERVHGRRASLKDHAVRARAEGGLRRADDSACRGAVPDSAYRPRGGPYIRQQVSREEGPSELISSEDQDLSSQCH